MPVTVVAAYEKGANIDLDKYLNEHHPKGVAAWGDRCKGFRVCVPVPPGQGARDECPYEMLAMADFDSAEDLKAAMDGISPEKMAELKSGLSSYSQKPPVLWTLQVKKSG